MSGTKPVGTFTDSNYATMSGTVYPLNLDACMAVAKRIVNNFAPHSNASPNMTVQVEPGYLYAGSTSTLTEVALQTSAVISAPVSLPRIDRIVADQSTGLISVVTGSENTAPSPPAIQSGKFPIAQVLLQTSTTAITNAVLTDERALFGGGGGGGGFQTQATIASASTTDVGSTQSNNVFISGSSAISSLGSSASTSAPIYLIVFGGALTLTNSAHLILPGGANITTAANDSMLANYSGGGAWQVYGYFSASGSAKMNASNTGALSVTGTLTAGSIVWAGNTVGTNAVGARTITTVAAGTPSGGVAGDIVYQTG